MPILTVTVHGLGSNALFYYLLYNTIIMKCSNSS